MGVRPVGIVNDKTAAAAGAFNRIELNPVVVITVTEVGMSHDAAANNTDKQVEYIFRRMSAVSTGTAATIVKMRQDLSEALSTTGLVDCTVDGTEQDVLHRMFVPTISGAIWSAAPNRDWDCQAADFAAVQNVAALPSGVIGAYYMVFEE